MSKLTDSKLLHIATIGKTVGLKGDIKLHIHTDFPQQFKKNSSFYINEKDSITLSDINLEKGLIRVAGYNSLEEAQKLTNKKLYTTIERTRQECHLEEGEHFWFDLVGCKVIEAGKTVGVVEEVERISITNYLFIKSDTSLVDNGLAKSFLLPLQKPFILDVDIQNKTITVSGAIDILEAS